MKRNDYHKFQQFISVIVHIIIAGLKVSKRNKNRVLVS
jgi:hypothetical protein